MRDIRELKNDEIESALALVWKVFMQYEAPEYSQEGIDEFKKSIYDSKFLARLRLFGAFDEQELIGVIATRSNGNHIALFFVDEKYQGKGIGRKLFLRVCKENSIKKLTVHSSSYAVPIYHHLGFYDTDKEQVTNGLRYTPMECSWEDCSKKNNMSNHYVEVDEKNWKRALHCSIFRNSVEPAFCVTFELDITNFLPKVREQHYSFTMALIYAVSKCANEIEEFRYRFVDGKIVLYDRIDTAFTYLNKETELFKVVNVEMQDTMEAYVTVATKAAMEQQAYFTGPLGNNVFQFSPMPWVSYTHISHTNAGKKDNATPLFDWGKYFERDHKMILPFSVQAHHSFVDGLHIGKLADKLQEFLDED